MANREKLGDRPFSHEVQVLLGPELVEAANRSEIKRNPDFPRGAASGPKSPGNF